MLSPTPLIPFDAARSFEARSRTPFPSCSFLLIRCRSRLSWIAWLAALNALKLFPCSRMVTNRCRPTQFTLEQTTPYPDFAGDG